MHHASEVKLQRAVLCYFGCGGQTEKLKYRAPLTFLNVCQPVCSDVSSEFIAIFRTQKCCNTCDTRSQGLTIAARYCYISSVCAAFIC
jgi:hypothetical protein